jgi:hypothetical protein
MKQIKENANYIISCAWIKFDHTGTSVEVGYPKKLGAMFNNITINFLSGTLLLKKRYFQEAGGYDIELSSGQHTELLMRLLPIFKKNTVKIVSINEPLIKIHLHKGERIRNNYDGIFKGSTRTLKKHKQLFEKDPKMNFNYNSIAAVMALRTGRVFKARRYLKMAMKINPFQVKSYMRYIISYFPPLINKFYPNNR